MRPSRQQQQQQPLAHTAGGGSSTFGQQQQQQRHNSSSDDDDENQSERTRLNKQLYHDYSPTDNDDNLYAEANLLTGSNAHRYEGKIYYPILKYIIDHQWMECGKSAKHLIFFFFTSNRFILT